MDYGCGPGITLEAILNSRGPAGGTIAQAAYACDISPEMVEKSKQQISCHCRTKDVRCEPMNAFANEHSTDVTREFHDWMPACMDVAYCSLVSEHLSFSQIESLSLAIWDRIADGGILAWFEWSEHFEYSGDAADGVKHLGGVPKHRWLELRQKLYKPLKTLLGCQKKLLAIQVELTSPSFLQSLALECRYVCRHSM
jgi:SAM-dependent methyltransferase